LGWILEIYFKILIENPKLLKFATYQNWEENIVKLFVINLSNFSLMTKVAYHY